MLKQKSFWLFTTLFTLFFVSVMVISINMYSHNEQKLLENAVRAHTELAKYLSKSIEENDSEELEKELEHNHLNLECLSKKCAIPTGFSLMQTVDNRGDIIEVYSGSDSKIGLRIITSTHEAFLSAKDQESPRHLKVVAVLFGLSFLMGSLYALAIANLAKTAKIEQLLAQKEEFLCSVSHEIKTPLAKAKLALEFIEDGSKKDKVQNAIRQIDILTSTLLNAHRKEQTSQQKCKASFLLSEAKKAILSEDNIDVEIVNDFEIESNLGECTTAIKNLLENAVKHSSDNKCKVVVDKSCIEVSNTTLSPLDELESLNKPFKKGENSTGFGLGLYLVQSIANRNKFSLKLLQQDGVAKFQMIFGAQK